MIPAFVIHHPSHVQRADVVKDLCEKTKAVVFEAHLMSDPISGCMSSHLGVARLAKSLHPESHYLVLEDDCELLEGWDQLLVDVSGFDVTYLGYTDRCYWATFGTHALVLSPKARDILLEKGADYGQATKPKNTYDHALSELCRKEGLSVRMPQYGMHELFCRQKRGLKSTITGHIRT